MMRPNQRMKNHNVTNRTFCVVGIALLMASCAGTPRRAADPPARITDSGGGKPVGPNTRIKDSAPEKAAALRAADRNLQLESEDQRWGIEAARERRRTTDEHAAEERRKEKSSKAIVPLGPGSGRVEVPPGSTVPGSPSP
jgi:hypothetical protein